MAYLLDTNIVSELRKSSRAAASVRAWFETARWTKPFLSVLVLGELRHGIEKQRGKDLVRTTNLERWLRGLTQDFDEQILPVTLEIADLYGRLCSNHRLPPFDGLMAATALVHDLTIATRNTRDFERSGARLLNPFQEV